MERNYKVIDDLSFSNIVNLVQGNSASGNNLIYSLALELEDTRNQIKEIEAKLIRLKGRANALLTGGKLVAQHLNKDIPLAVMREGCIVVISDTNMTVERNVI